MFEPSHLRRSVDMPGESRFSRRAMTRSRRHKNQRIILELVDEKNNVLPFECFDISPAGAYLHSNFLLQCGEEVNLRVRIDYRLRPIEIAGEVVRVETGEDGLSPGMGIAFREISKQDSHDLKQYLFRRFLGNG